MCDDTRWRGDGLRSTTTPPDSRAFAPITVDLEELACPLKILRLQIAKTWAHGTVIFQMMKIALSLWKCLNLGLKFDFLVLAQGHVLPHYDPRSGGRARGRSGIFSKFFARDSTRCRCTGVGDTAKHSVRNDSDFSSPRRTVIKHGPLALGRRFPTSRQVLAVNLLIAGMSSFSDKADQALIAFLLTASCRSTNICQAAKNVCGIAAPEVYCLVWRTP